MHSVFSNLQFRSLELLSPLVLDLHIALRVQEHLGALRARAERAERALDAIPVAVLVLDVHGAIVHVDQPAISLLERSDGLRELDGRLCCQRAEETTHLHAAVERLAQQMLRGDIPACTTSRCRAATAPTRSGCRRQAELVLMLTGSVAALPMPTLLQAATPVTGDMRAS